MSRRSIGRDEPDREQMLGILRLNTGFDDPERWVNYALQHSFKRVHAIPILCCPDCGARPRRALGQYVYYSTLIRLRECGGCGLIWADAQLDPRVVAQHFGEAYKDETYFVGSRRLILSHISALIDRLAPPGAGVLDIGGAKGHLMAEVRRRRPDVRITINDISEGAIDWASRTFGFETILGDAHILARQADAYDLIVLSDVLYYVADIASFWAMVPGLLKPGGSLLIRVPNRLGLIRLGRIIGKIRAWPSKQDSPPDSISAFNPEHIYVFSRRYLERRLDSLGFSRVDVTPSPALIPPSASIRGLMAGMFRLALAANRLSAGHLVFSPSMIVIGRYRR